MEYGQYAEAPRFDWAFGLGVHHLGQGGQEPRSGSPDAGRKLFLNCIRYIHKFDDRQPPVHGTSSQRLNATKLALLINRIDDKSFFSVTLTPEQVKHKGDAKGPADYCGQNLGLVRRDKTFMVGSALQGLGLSPGRTVETPDRLIEVLGDGRRAEAAVRLLARYTDESFGPPQQGRCWFAGNKDRSYFSDVGGYKFFMVPEAHPVGRKNQTPIGESLYR